MQFFLAFALFLICGITNTVVSHENGSTPLPSEGLWESFDKRLLKLEKQQVFDVQAVRSIISDLRFLIESNTPVIKVNQTEGVPNRSTSSLYWKNDTQEYCSRFSNAYTAFIPVNGTSFKFKVRGRYDATIGFASKAWENPTYDIMIGDFYNMKTNIYKERTLIVESLTPGILDPCEYRDFWVTWDNNIIRLGRHGNSAAILTHHIENLHPINFIGIRTTVHSKGDWIV